MRIYSFAKIYPVKIFATSDKIRANLSYKNIVTCLFFNFFNFFLVFFLQITDLYMFSLIKLKY